ncbi:MAG: hypothetical protein KBH85_05170 [Lachnospiraceae bacterium]|jgi:hypothetical protein|nr:hypothetical protein [Lachnospiraceae bacterium]
MDKNETAEQLRKHGFECSVDSGVVMIKGHKDSQFLSAVKKELSDIGYDGSFGIHGISSGMKQSEMKENVSASDVDDSIVTDSDLAGSIMTDGDIDGSDMDNSDMDNSDIDSNDIGKNGADGSSPEIDYSDDGQGTFNF